MKEHLLWQLGSVDHDSSDFALFGNPEAAATFGEVDFVVGKNDAKLDWPYVQPGPEDEFGGRCERAYRLHFDAKALPGACKLVLHLVDVRPEIGATLAVRINDAEAMAALPPGTNYESLHVSSCAGAFSFDVPFSCSLLEQGENRIEIRTVQGGYVIYDCIELIHLPDELPDGDLHDLRAEALPFLTGEEEALRQMIEVAMDNWGPDRNGQLSLRLRKRGIAEAQQVTVPFGCSIHTFAVPEIREACEAEVEFTDADGRGARRASTLSPRRRWRIYLAPHEGIADEFFGLNESVGAAFERLKFHLAQIENAHYPFDAILVDVLTDDNERLLRVVDEWKSHWTYPEFVLSDRVGFFEYIAKIYGAGALETFGDVSDSLPPSSSRDRVGSADLWGKTQTSKRHSEGR